MDVYTISAAGIEKRPADDLKVLLERPDALIWVDVPVCDPDEAAVLSDVFGFHDLELHDAIERNHIAKTHIYGDHAFVAVHAPELGSGGHVHYIELDQFIGANYLVTVHGPLNPVVDPGIAFIDTKRVEERIEHGDLRPTSPMELSYAITAALIRREIDLVAALASESGRLEQQVTDDDRDDDPEALLEDLFEVGHKLLSIRTIATHSAEAYRGLANRARSVPSEEIHLIEDLADRFEMVRSMADGQKEFVHGVIDFFQTRTNTHMTIAADKLAQASAQQNNDVRRITAWVAIVAVPTAVTGFFGQNVPYPGFGKQSGVIASAVIIVCAAVLLYVIFKTKKWL